jgi:hypothetical protein
VGEISVKFSRLPSDKNVIGEDLAGDLSELGIIQLDCFNDHGNITNLEESISNL